MRVFDSRGKGSAVAIMVGVDSLDLRFFSLHSVIRGVGVRGFPSLGGPGAGFVKFGGPGINLRGGH